MHSRLTIAESLALQSSPAPAQLVKLGAIGAAAVLVLLLGIWIMAKRDVFAPSDGNRDTAAEREEEGHLNEVSEFDIPMRARVRALSGPAKSVLASGVILLGFFGYTLYKIFQTGSPATNYLTLELVVVAVAVLGVLGGVRLHRWAESRLGVMFNVYESAEGEPEVEKVEFYRSERLSIGGNDTLQQLHPARLLGVFRKRMLIGQHRELRSSPKPLTDTVIHSVPDGEHSFEVDDGVIINLTQGEPEYSHSAGAPADVHYRSPNSLSYERANSLRQSQRRMRIERDAAQTTQAALDEELERLAEMVINREWQTREDLMSLLQDYSELQNNSQPVRVETQQGGVGRSADAGGSSVLAEADKNGAKEEGD